MSSMRVDWKIGVETLPFASCSFYHRADHLAHLTPKNLGAIQHRRTPLSNTEQPLGILDPPSYLRTLSILPSVLRWVLKRLTHFLRHRLSYHTAIASTLLNRSHPLPCGAQLHVFLGLERHALDQPDLLRYRGTLTACPHA